MSSEKLRYRIEKVHENVQIEDGIFKLTVKGDFTGNPGQFYMIRSWRNEPLLSRPISIHQLDEEKISFLYQMVGEGTEFLSNLRNNQEIELMGPLGNGFEIDNIKGNIAVVTGGIGIAPMLYTIKKLRECKIDLYSGFREKSYIVNEFKDYVENIEIATDSGEEGFKGYITELLKPEQYDMVLCCGPEIMMEKVVRMCREKKVKVYVSMEKHMACGIGACLVCTCKTKHGNKRTCKDGPVFSGEEIIVM